MTVVNYSVQDIFGPNERFWVGTEWFIEVLNDKRLHEALWRQFLFSGLVLLIEIPLGVLIALAMPKKGWTVSLVLVLIALPLPDPVERHRHYLDHLYPPRHRPVRRLHQRHRHRLRPHR